MSNLNLIQYGAKCKSSEVKKFLSHVIQTNIEAEKNGKPKTPICIWGTHGIGKTDLVKEFAKENGFDFLYIAPAQFEEMGDLLGMPKIIEKEDGSLVTKFIPPDWIPKEEKPGILLIDDVNRADDRILRGIMQLLQNYEMVSWTLPKKWHIVLTANPDGGDYSVTSMDLAMLTRMHHITMEFDVKKWSLWAESKKIDYKGINFVLTYPEVVVNGERTTPRTLVQFFESISHIKNLKESLDLVKIIGESCLDENTVNAFIAYVNNYLFELVSVSEILEATNFKEQIFSPLNKLINGEQPRLDILSVLMTRLLNFLIVNPNKKYKNSEIKNIKSFLKMNFIPKDMLLTMGQGMMEVKNEEIQNIWTDPKLSMILFSDL